MSLFFDVFLYTVTFSTVSSLIEQSKYIRESSGKENTCNSDITFIFNQISKDVEMVVIVFIRQYENH